jgi:hypothetical protein
MTNTITLTKEEMALIEQKRADDRAKEEALRTSYDHYKTERIKARELVIDRRQKDAEALKKVYEGFYNSLIAVSPDFKLDCKKVTSKDTIDLYELDKDGYEIQMVYDEQGSPVSRLKPKEIISLDSYAYSFKLSYTGKVPEGHSFYVNAVTTHSSYSGRVTGYKMQIQGTGINSWDGRGKMVNPKAIVNRLIGLSEDAFRAIEYKSAAELTQQRIQAAFQEKYGHLENEGVKISRSPGQFVLTYENGIQLTIGAYESNSEIKFTNTKVNIPYGFDADKLIGGLKSI